MAAVSQTETLDAPIGGWDAFSSLDNMPPQNAIVLDNLIPSNGTVDSRKGHFVYADLGTDLPVETVVSYDPRLESDHQLLAASGGGIWNITGGTLMELAPEATYGNDRWQSRNFRKADEEGVLVMCNGDDPVQIFDGNALSTAVFNDAEDPPNPLSPTFVGCIVYKGRMYYWENEDNAFWYCQPGAYQGTIQKFDLGSFVGQGGWIKFITTWTQQDSGDGKDDFFVVVFNTGETLIYQGDDPETIGYWDLVGRYTMAEPLSIRSADKYGSDTIIMTRDGYVALSSIVQQGRTSDVPQFSRLIHGAITKRTRSSNIDRFGWESTLFQRDGLMIFNVPLSSSTFEQHVLNTVTERWCRFRSINCSTFAVHDEQLYGGGDDGKVYQVLEGTSDNGVAIQCAALPAFNYMGRSGVQKHLCAINPLTTNTDPTYINVTGYADYAIPVITPVEAPPKLNEGIWSINPAVPPEALGSFWDEDYWAIEGNPFTSKGWQNISAYGYAVSYLMRFAKLNDTAKWRATVVRFFYGGAQ